MKNSPRTENYLKVIMKAQMLIAFALIAALLILLMTTPPTLAGTGTDSSTGSNENSIIDWVVSKVNHIITSITNIIRWMMSLILDLLNIIPIFRVGNKVLVLITTIARWLHLLS